jgi:predicted kinase
MSDELFLLQLSGAPGSGKSRLADAIAARRSAVVVNSDVVKSTLLDADVPWSLAGPAAYQVLFALAGDLLRQGHNVVLDSPSHYDFIPANGQRVAREHGARYRFLELVCDDVDELRRRLTGRRPLRSQMLDLDRPPVDSDGPTRAVRVGTHRWRTAGPEEGHRILDTDRPFDDYLTEALEYVDT